MAQSVLRIDRRIVPTESFVLAAAKEFLEPLTQRSAFKASRLAVLHDGSTVPVLELLAKRRYPNGWDEDQFPFWIDGNRQNETLSNVGLATRSSNGKARQSAFGVPAGTKEYMRLWREKNREKMRAAHKRHAEKQKRVLELALEAAENVPVLEKLLRATQKEPTDV